MILTRRQMLRLGGSLAAGLLAVPAEAGSKAPSGITHVIRMRSDPTGAHVGFDPVGLRILPGQSVRWTNGDAGNAHTSTAYHPANFGRPRRIPALAEPWNSDYLLQGEAFSVTLTAQGVYDYYCVPHEHAGMVGRIVVGDPAADGWLDDPASAGDLPAVALNGFPPLGEIMSKGIVRHA